MIKQLIFVITLISSGLIFSGCNTNAGDLLTQAIKSDSPFIEVTSSDNSEAPVKILVIEGYGNVLTNKRNLALYTKKSDTALASSCYEDCELAWPPFLIADPNEVSGNYGFFERTNGDFQVTYKGKPLYTYKLDKTRTVTGDGFQDEWSVVIIEEAEESE